LKNERKEMERILRRRKKKMMEVEGITSIKMKT